MPYDMLDGLALFGYDDARLIDIICTLSRDTVS